MTQTIKTIKLNPHDVIVIFKSARALNRRFFGIYILGFIPSVTNNLEISFGDSNFTQCFTLTPDCNYFESKGKNIFQGSILIRNINNITYWINATEILE